MSNRDHDGRNCHSIAYQPYRESPDSDKNTTQPPRPGKSFTHTTAMIRTHSPEAELSQRGTGAIPLSRLVHEGRHETAPTHEKRSKTEAEMLPEADITVGNQVVSNDRAAHTSSARRRYFDPARELDQPEGTPTPQAGARKSRFQLKLMQQPAAARACGHGERDRRVIDPPPILQLTLENFDPSSEEDRAELQSLHKVVHCKLYNTTANPRDVSTMRDPTDRQKLVRSLMGTTSATLFVGTDPSAPTTWPEEHRIGVYYIFPDISCRHTGKYRLYFELLSLSMDVGVTKDVVAIVKSDIFEVYSAKDFPGMRPSSALTCELKRQGANLSIKKGVDVKVGRRKKKSGGAESEDSSGEG